MLHQHNHDDPNMPSLAQAAQDAQDDPKAALPDLLVDDPWGAAPDGSDAF